MKQIALFLLLCFGKICLAQELNCNVILVTDQLNTTQVTEKTIFEEMKKSIFNFLNKREWTTEQFEPQERIECELQITLTQMPTQGFFNATAQIKVLRPIYGTDYKTITMMYVDRSFNFQYLQSQPMDFNENTFSNDLTSMLAFYAYVILGTDFDTFAKMGGERYVKKAFDLTNIAQQSGDGGWKRGQDLKNRYWVAENLMSQQFIPYREAMYGYFRLGLDRFLIDADKSRQEIFNALTKMEEVNKLRPSAVLINSFFDMKADELVKIFQEAPLEMRKKTHAILVKIDPARTGRYNTLIN